jgi:desulfoferrodoxin-like iron-binding protein
MAKAKKGDLFTCELCGLVVAVDEFGDSVGELICCDVPMEKGKAKKKAAKPAKKVKKPAKAKKAKAAPKKKAKPAKVKKAAKPKAKAKAKKKK